MDITWKELGFFLTRLKNLPVSKSLELGENGFCVSTGCDLESWVYYPERVNNIGVVERTVEFFKKEKISFMWPVYDGGEKFLEECGLFYSESWTGMIFEPKNFQEALNTSKADSRDWALTAWQGFGDEADKISENYFSMVEAFNNEPSFSLYAHKTENNFDGSFMLVENNEENEEKNLTGVYYFSVIPEMRRRGIAKLMMNEICSLSRGKKILLQATPMGLPFYKKFGFQELCRIPVYKMYFN